MVVIAFFIANLYLAVLKLLMTYPLNDPISAGTRLCTMFLDYCQMSIVAMLFSFPMMISGISHGPMLSFSLFGFSLYFCKDIVNGRSLSKRRLGLQVVDNKTGQVATPLQCFVRNIFCLLWIIEAFVALANTRRRLGDLVAGTKLVKYNHSLEQPEINYRRLALPVAISYGFLLTLQFLSSP